MKISELWLREWVSPPIDGAKLADRLTMAGLQVDEIYPVASLFNGVIVAEVKHTSPHPQADKLTLCDVNLGKASLLKVVCGAANVRTGLKVALAQVGAELPGVGEIKPCVLRGETSQGMLCSAAELGLAESSNGILELDQDAPVGNDLRDYLFLNDQILDIDLTPNRADCLSVIGIAREVAALTKLSLPVVSQPTVRPTIDVKAAVKVMNSDDCPHYCGRIIRNLNTLAKTPLWLSERLRRVGIRTVHPVVDVTNYIMLELGQPMHAFNLDRINSDGLVVRNAEPNEHLKLLNGQNITLNQKILVIADSEKPLALAGIMGSEESAVSEETNAIFLESAFFNPLKVAGVARSFGLCTDSSQRFERGVDPFLQQVALERATDLILKILGGEAGPTTVISEPHLMEKRSIVSFEPKKVRQLTGVSIDETIMTHLLGQLGFTVKKSPEVWKVGVPSYRFDIHQDVDLVEEIIRLYGYENLCGTKMTTVLQSGSLNVAETISIHIANFLQARGYHEVINYSFVDPALQQALFPEYQQLQLSNPISTELAQMRVSLWPGLLASLIYNSHRQQKVFKLFECGVVFNQVENELQESQSVAGLLYGETGTMNWSELTTNYDFYDAKGDLQSLFNVLQWDDVQFESASHTALHPGKSASIKYAGETLGWCGVLHPRLAKALELSREVCLFEIRLPPVFLERKRLKKFKSISKFPQIHRDLSLLVPEEVTAAQIENIVRQVVTNDWLKNFAVFDVYRGVGIPEGKRSVSIALVLQDDSRTLVDEEINCLIDAIIKALEEKLSVNLRD